METGVVVVNIPKISQTASDLSVTHEGTRQMLCFQTHGIAAHLLTSHHHHLSDIGALYLEVPFVSKLEALSDSLAP